MVLANELRAHLPLSGGSLECAVLNACCTGGAAGRADGGLGSLGDLLHQCGMPAVLCWRSRVHNEASAHFAAGFGAALVRGETYSAAFEQVRLRLRAGPLPLPYPYPYPYLYPYPYPFPYPYPYPCPCPYP